MQLLPGAPAVPPAKAPPAPAPGTAAARVPAAAPGTPAQRPATPAGAPAPAPSAPASARQPAVPAGARAGATAPAGSGAAAPAAAPARERPDGDGTGAATGTRVAAKPPPRPTGGQAGAARPARPAAAPLRATRPAATPASRPPLSGGRGRGRALADRLGRRGAALIALLVLVLVIGGVYLVASSGGGGSASKPVAAKPNAVGPAPAPTKKRSSDGAPVQRGKITVAVLNGTTIPGLAAQISDQLQKGGFKRGSVTNASDQQRPGTQVAYAPGYKRAGDEVAGLLKIRSAAQPMDAGTQAIAGPDAAIVVTVGTDRTQ